jgi:hypothetical protein
MDLTAKIRVITLSVKQTAPPISTAASLADLLELPSCNISSPRTKRDADRIISNTVDILFIGRPPRKPINPSSYSNLSAFLRPGSRPPAIAETQQGLGFREFPESRLGIDLFHFRTAHASRI